MSQGWKKRQWAVRDVLLDVKVGGLRRGLKDRTSPGVGLNYPPGFLVNLNFTHWTTLAALGVIMRTGIQETTARQGW